jgi:hypothetical protein
MEVGVMKQLQKMKPGTAAGFDGLGAGFLKYATKVVGQRPVRTENVLKGWLSKLMFVAMGKGIIPECWKTAKLTPLFKAKDEGDPANYRLLAISTVLYRLFANTLRAFTTAWCVDHNVLPASQFGFCPGRSAQQAQFILRHAVHLVKQQGPGNRGSLICVFIDFKQAFDRVVGRGCGTTFATRWGSPRFSCRLLRACMQVILTLLLMGASPQARFSPPAVSSRAAR